MKVLLCSTLCSKKSINILRVKTGLDVSGHTLQKYYRLIVSGLVNNGVDVTTATSIPIVRCHNRWLKLLPDCEDSVYYCYVRTINLPILRQLSILISTFFIGIKWLLQNRNQAKFVIVDVLNISTSLGALMLKPFGIHVMGLMTDMPGLMVTDKGFVMKCVRRFNMWLLGRYDSYIFLTEAMNEAINKKQRPYIVMEGLVDSNMENSERIIDPSIRKIIYAGSLHEQYGIKTLVEGFMKVKGDNLRLMIYGGGPFANQLSEYEIKDSRIKYYGLRPNTEIVKEELSATLLVNPRPSHEDFVKFSFPSKNMEYMVSGTPLLTTNLTGMPEEYKKYVYIIKEETVEGMSESLDYLLNNLAQADLDEKGASAKRFVLEKKNNIIQMGRVVALYKSAVR